MPKLLFTPVCAAAAQGARSPLEPNFKADRLTGVAKSRCAMVFGGVVSMDGLELVCIGAPGHRAHRSVAMAPMFKGIRFGRHHFCNEV